MWKLVRGGRYSICDQKNVTCTRTDMSQAQNHVAMICLDYASALDVNEEMEAPEEQNKGGKEAFCKSGDTFRSVMCAWLPICRTE